MDIQFSHNIIKVVFLCAFQKRVIIIMNEKILNGDDHADQKIVGKICMDVLEFLLIMDS